MLSGVEDLAERMQVFTGAMHTPHIYPMKSMVRQLEMLFVVDMR